MNKNKISPISAFNKLRKYQQDACSLMGDYFDNYSQSELIKTGLVAMPTGSGKTPIIAFLSRCYSSIDNVLVISPRVAISEQLCIEINTFFNEKLQLKAEIPKKVQYYDANVSIADFNNTNVVLVSTIQKLDYLKRQNSQKEYKLLKKKISLIIFDEGHYEPAISWSGTIRDFMCPRILFTATPFRNDLKSFDFDDDYKYQLKHNEVKNQKYLRKVEFLEFQLSTIEEKVESILENTERYTTNFNEPKLIISCDNKDTIIRIAKILISKGKEFYAIHETFNTAYKSKLDTTISKFFLQNVPKKPAKEKKPIWIHQYKLLEGIDIPSFQLLAIIEPFKNTRALIQQVGRIIRNINKESTPSYVFDYTEDNNRENWKAYLELDESGELMEGFSFNTFNQFQKQLPERAYIDKKFRKKFDLNSFANWGTNELLNEIALPLKVNLLEKLSNFSPSNFIKKEIETRFKENDKIPFGNISNGDFYIYYYFTVNNSNFLKEAYFPSISHDICFFKEYKNFIAFYDSSEYLPIGKDELGIGMSISSNKLKNLFKNDESSILTQVSLKNSNIGSRDIRDHTFRAPSIEHTTPFLNDFSHYLNSAFGLYSDLKPYKDYKKEELKHKRSIIKTYVGFSTGRISQNEPKNLKLKEYVKWLDNLVGNLNTSNDHIKTFQRYATNISNSSNKVPANILLDLFDIDQIINIDGFEDDFISDLIMDKCMNITDNGSGKVFELMFNESTYDVTINYDEEKRKYLLNCPNLLNDTTGENSENKSALNLLKLLNEKQSFRVLTSTNQLYANGNFYDPKLAHGENYDDKTSVFENILMPIEELKSIGSEKGTKSIKNETWEPNTLFNLIDTLGVGTEMEPYFKNTDFIICDDMGTELADFILVKEEKLIFIHVKGKGNNPMTKPSLYSASAISEVINQAMKNIYFMSYFDDAPRIKYEKWSGAWELNNKRLKIHSIVNNRIRNNVNNLSLDEIWDKIEKLKYNPNTEKEVWLLLGKTFSKSSFISKLKQKNPPAEAFQSAISLKSAIASIGSMGVKTKVFCSK
ncbi:DEAD/DEAH box helicase [Ancylomarina longa]|uniref:DEAD/DEAH box helicase n=1 Tax=Ancylomarina longa TaxID=2487017 RepID=A0A434AFB5_9BACT|nr:DEAD/DEAH box helicase family protein [Ancylomarina longa]RUT73038.1 DEAD/DEAH box helicase [Ancylomarina longa]